MSEHSSDEEVARETRGEFAGAIEELHAMKLTASQQKLLDDCVAVDEFRALLQSLVLRDEGAHAVRIGLAIGDLKQRLKSMLILKKMRDRSPERMRRLTSLVRTGFRINGEPKAGDITFRAGARKILSTRRTTRKCCWQRDAPTN